MLLDSFALQLFYCFAFWKFWIHNVERIFWILTGKMPKGHGTMGVGVSETAMKDKELVTFSLSFSLLFFTILDSGRQNYWIDWSVLFSFSFSFFGNHYFLFYSLIFSPCFFRFLHRSHWLVPERETELLSWYK